MKKNLTSEELLKMLTEERAKYSNCDDTRMDELIQELVTRGVYPSETVTGIPIRKMVDSYGANWHIWKGRLECPYCKADLRDLKNGPPFLRTIALYSRSTDRTTGWRCPDCRESFGLKNCKVQ